MRLVRHLTLPVAIAALLVTVTARPVFAGGPVLHVPAAELRAGETVELRWSGVPADCEELEILLSVDGGRTYPLRVSAELEPRDGAFRWRVPNLAAGRARLRLRYGIEHGERDGVPTGLFRIVADPGAPPASFGFHEGDWWEPFEGEPAPRADDLDAPAISLAGAGADLAPPRTNTAPPTPARTVDVVRVTGPTGSRSAPRSLPPSLRVPLRN